MNTFETLLIVLGFLLLVAIATAVAPPALKRTPSGARKRRPGFIAVS